jgi:hypothetical protein
VAGGLLAVTWAATAAYFVPELFRLIRSGHQLGAEEVARRSRRWRNLNWRGWECWPASRCSRLQRRRGVLLAGSAVSFIIERPERSLRGRPGFSIGESGGQAGRGVTLLSIGASIDVSKSEGQPAPRDSRDARTHRALGLALHWEVP